MTLPSPNIPIYVLNNLFPHPDQPIVIDSDGVSHAIAPMTVQMSSQEHPYKGQLAYHYTNRAGWTSIIRSRTLWLSSYRSLLDPSEGTYGISYVYKLLCLDNRCKEILKTEDDFLNLRNWLLHHLFSVKIYVCSFCLVPDDLNLWREYAQKDGVALGVPLNALQQFADITPGLAVLRVFYRQNEHLKVIRPLVDEIGEHLVRTGPAAMRKRLPDRIAVNLLQSVMTIKHPAYSSENEVRVVSDRAVSGIHWRGKKTNRIEYTNLDICKCLDVLEEKYPVFPQVQTSPNFSPSDFQSISRMVVPPENRALHGMVHGSTIPLLWREAP